MNIIRELYEDFKAWRRGEHRIAPIGQRGRVYARKGSTHPDGPNANVRLSPAATLQIKVTRAGGSVETHLVPASVESTN